MIIYNKLIRDRIPEIMDADNKTYEIKTLNEQEFITALNEKLVEELAEYQKAGELSELADLVEVVLALVEAKGSSTSDFEQLRLSKRQKRGAFKKRLFLISVSEKDEKRVTTRESRNTSINLGEVNR